MATFNPKSFNTYVARKIPKSVSALLNRPKPPQWALALARQKRAQFDRWRVEGTPFLVGQKKVYLPKFTVTFLRTPFLAPQWAQFVVPLYFNKLDMRDYMFHAYNVTTKKIRSYIAPRGIERRTRVTKPAQRRHFRPRGVKKMTVQLESPFVWPKAPDPDKPEDWRPWDRDRFHEMMGLPRNSEEKEAQRAEKSLARQRVKSHESIEKQNRSDLRKLAEDYLSGKKKWGNVHPDAIPKDPRSSSTASFHNQ